jgi:hypothetical protein
MGIALLIPQEHLRDSNSAASATLSMTSALILISMRRLRHLELLLTFAFSSRSHLMASTGNNGAVQLWQDGEKLDDGCCQCNCGFFCPMDSYSV